MAHRDYEGFKPDLTQDIPVAYAVFEPIWDDEKKQVLDTRYVFVNEKYCKLAGAKREDLVGKLFTECYGTINRQWFQFCYEAVVLGKTIRQRAALSVNCITPFVNVNVILLKKLTLNLWFRTSGWNPSHVE